MAKEKQLTVQELIKFLQTCDPKSKVFYNGWKL